MINLFQGHKNAHSGVRCRLDRLLHALFLDKALMTGAQSLWAACPTGLFWPRKWVPLVASFYN